MRNRLLVVLILIATFAAAIFMIGAPVSDAEWLKQFIETSGGLNWFRENPSLGIPLLLATIVLATAVGFPRQAAAFVSGYLLGFVSGLIVTAIGMTIGATLCFYFARYAGRPWVKRKYPKQALAFDHFVERDSFLKVVIVRFLPFGTNLTTNLAAGISSIKVGLFLCASLVGYLPHLIIFVLAGNGFQDDSNIQLSISAALFVLSLLMSAYLYRKYKLESVDDK